MKKLLIALFLLLFLTSCGKEAADVVIEDQVSEPVATQELGLATQDAVDTTIEEVIEPEPEIKEIPATFDHDVTFASQAPFSNWALPYQEACEEASLIMAYKYFANEKLDKQIMDNEIKKLVDWQNKTFGYYTDTNLEEVKYIAEEYFNLDVEVSEKVEVDFIKQMISDGNLIIVPASGRDLDNPNFTAPGPIFHMLVIRGYDRNEFITNDPGTRKGLKFKYKYSNLIDSIHDLIIENGEQFRPYELKTMADSLKLEKMRSGPKKILIIKGLK
jgi:uncharacterized protein YvpB